MNRDTRVIGIAILLALATLAAHPARATFEGMNGKIALAISVPGAPGELNSTFAIGDVDGQQLTFPDSNVRSDSDPAFSPDGELIAYIRQDSTLNDTFIRITNADGSEDYQLLSSDSISEAAVLSWPSWSADGQKIAFNVSVPNAMNEGGIFTIDADGDNLVRVVENDSTILQTVYNPEWSPRGRTIAYVCRWRFTITGKAEDLCTLDTNTGQFAVLYVNLTDQGVDVPLVGAARDLGPPHWTPDGQRLVFAASYLSTDRVYAEFINPETGDYMGATGPEGNPYLLSEVYSIRKDGTSLKRLTRGRPVPNTPVVPYLHLWGGPGIFSDTTFAHPIPSPDGEQIVAIGHHFVPVASYNGLYRLQKDGSAVLIKKPIESGANLGRIAWQPITDSPAVYVTDGHGHPIDGLKVELRSLEDPEQVLFAEPSHAGNGTYVFKNAPLGEYRVRVTLVDTTAPAGSPPSFNVRDEDTQPSAVTNMDRRVVFTGTSAVAFPFDDSDLDNLLGSNVPGDHLDDLAAIFRNMNLYLGWVRSTLQPDTGPTARIVAFSGFPPNPDGAGYLSDLDVIVMGPANSAYENRDGIPDPDHRDDAPENGEWHEFTHHLTHHHVRSIEQCERPPNVNHQGYPNPSSCDSLIEGLAAFFPAIAEREITGKADSWYGKLGDLEKHIKAWRPWPSPENPNETAEDMAVAALLWDVVDANVDLEFTQWVIAANGQHTLAPPWRDTISISPGELWQKLKIGSPLTVADLHATLSTPATASSAITIDLDGFSPADVSALDLLFLMHGFYAAIHDVDAPGLHPVEHFDVAAAQRLDPFSPRNAHVGRTDHFIHDPLGGTLGGIVPRRSFPTNPDAQLSIQVRDTAGNPLSGATVHLELPHTDFENDLPVPTGPSQRLETGSGVLHFEPPFHVDYPLAEGASLPACDDPNVTHVPVTVSATLNGHTSLNQPEIDNCAYWQAVFAGTIPAASVTLTFPVEASLPLTTAYTDLVPAEGGRPAYWSVELECADAGATDFASGCARIEYRIGGGPIATYDRPLRLAPPVQRFEYRSVDAAGNEEAFREVLFDSDADGISDTVELQQGTNPLAADTDADGALDAADNCPVVANPDQQNSDTDPQGDACDDDDDGDGLSDASEIAGGTDPRNPDTDGDALRDPDELALGTNPLDADSDDDALADGAEITNGANPLDSDSDDDGLLDGAEVDLGTSPVDVDSDDDGDRDAVDNCPLLANPAQEDLDGDGVGDVCDPNVGSTWKLIGITSDDRWATAKATLFELDTTNASATFVMALGNGGPGEAIAFNPSDGLLYHASGTVEGDKVWESIDIATRTIRSSGPLTTESGSQVAATTYSPATGRFLVLDDLGSVYDTTLAGVATYIASADRHSGLAFVGDALYGALAGDDWLYQVDPNTCEYRSEVRITLAGVAVEGTAGLATDPQTGTLWIIVNRPGDPQYLARIDPVTGVATAVGVLPDGFTGIAFVPEPSALLSLSAGAIATAIYANHRQRRRRYGSAGEAVRPWS